MYISVYIYLYISISVSIYLPIYIYRYIGIEYIPQGVLSKIKDKSITNNVFIIQSDASMLLCADFIVLL